MILFEILFQFAGLLNVVVVRGEIGGIEARYEEYRSKADSTDPVRTTNGHSIPFNGTDAILEFYQRVHKDEVVEDQEILLNLIKKSKASRKKKRYRSTARTEEPSPKPEKVTETRNYVTIPPERLKPKKKVKNIVTEMKKKRQKRRKVNSKVKTKKKHSNMQVRL